MKKEKFVDMTVTVDGKPRAFVDLQEINTLWFNTGTLCNLSCKNCYIESSPTNDQLEFLTAEEVAKYLLELRKLKQNTTTIGLTGGEPFLNPNIISILNTILAHNFEVLVLTNANRVIDRYKGDLTHLHHQYGTKLKIRISLDHHTQNKHEEERGPRTFQRTMEMMKWLSEQKMDISIAGRSLFHETIEDAKAGYGNLLAEWNIPLDLNSKLVIFPEMKTKRDLPEISTGCWDILGKSPKSVMCASERMIVKRKGEKSPVVMPCTLIAYDERFNLGNNLREAAKTVYLNHRFCAEFCVLGGASCSGTK